MNKSNVKKILVERLLEKGIENLNNEEQEQLFGNLKEKQKLVDEIFKPDNYGHSKWVFAVDLMKTDLKWGRNGLIRHGIAYGDNRYVWEKHPEFGTIEKLKTSGFNSNLLETLSRPIRKDIERYHKQFGCVVCGSNSKLVTDHKNDLYNDPRVLNINTQRKDDFQCLCQHCNLQKREIMKKTKAEGKRIGATTIPSLAIFDIDFILGDENSNKDDIDAMKGTYWYDPVAFMKYINDKLCS